MADGIIGTIGSDLIDRGEDADPEVRVSMAPDHFFHASL
jgi:hypothetical protein